MVSVDSRSLDKVLQICQKTSVKLDQITKKQDQLEAMINEQKDKITKILSKLEEGSEIGDNKGKDKLKGKRTNEFYRVNIWFIFSCLLCYILCCIYLLLTYEGGSPKIVV